MTSSETASYVHIMVSQITYVHRVDLLEKVFHQCGLCGELMLHDKYESFFTLFYIFGGNIAKPHQWQVLSVEVIFARWVPLRLTGWNSATSGILQCFPYWLLFTLYDWLPLVTLFQRLGGVSLAQPQVAHTPSVQWAVHGQSSWQVFSLSLSSSWCISIWREFVSIFVSKKKPK